MMLYSQVYGHNSIEEQIDYIEKVVDQKRVQHPFSK